LNSAAYVGRVGALAVALGIGSVIFAGQAAADGGDAASAPKSVASASEHAATADRSPARKTKPDKAGRDDAARPAKKPAWKKAPSAKAPSAKTPSEKAPSEKAPSGKRPSWKKPTAAATNAQATADSPADRAEPAADHRRLSSKTPRTSDADPAAPPRTAPRKFTLHTATADTASSTAKAPAVLAKDTRKVDLADRPVATAVVNVVRSMVSWAHERADAGKGQSTSPTFLMALVSAAGRELEALSATRAPRRAAAHQTSAAVAAAAATPYSPWSNPQVSPSTNFVSWVTGNYHYADEKTGTNADTADRFSVWGTDVGTMWDNGMVDDPTTPWNEHQVLIAVGDTFSGANMTGRHIFNTLFRSSDTKLSDGMTIPKGEWFTGNMFGGAPLDGPVNARPIINPQKWLPSSLTMIPTAGVSVNVPVTKDTPYGTIQYVSYMSVTKWGSAGKWTTNYSAIGYSVDNGENFTIDPKSIRNNSFLSGNKNFQQSAFVKGDDGYVYVYGTPNGRQGAAYLARVAPESILDTSKYEYYRGASKSLFGSTAAGWVKGNPSAATAIIGKSGGFWGFTKPGYTVSEMSVQYNAYLDKYVVLYGDQNNSIVMRTSDTPEGLWSDAAVLMTQQPGGIYAPMLHPWSPSTLGTGPDLYWNLSLWSSYDIMLMHTDLTKV